MWALMVTVCLTMTGEDCATEIHSNTYKNYRACMKAKREVVQRASKPGTVWDRYKNLKFKCEKQK